MEKVPEGKTSEAARTIRWRGREESTHKIKESRICGQTTWGEGGGEKKKDKDVSAPVRMESHTEKLIQPAQWNRAEVSKQTSPIDLYSLVLDWTSQTSNWSRETGLGHCGSSIPYVKADQEIRFNPLSPQSNCVLQKTYRCAIARRAEVTGAEKQLEATFQHTPRTHLTSRSQSHWPKKSRWQIQTEAGRLLMGEESLF